MNSILNLDETLMLAIDWAKKVGKIQMTYFRGNDLDIHTKSSVNDVVTRVDKESESFILQEIFNHFPDHAVLGEEGGEHQGKVDYRWVIDPLDGTNNFSQGLPIFTVSIALQHGDDTVLGVVYAPYLDELYVGLKGKGAWLNGKKIKVATKTDLAHSVLCTGFPYDKDINPDNNADNLVALLPHIRGVRRQGSAAYDLCCVAAGWLDGYWELSLHLWDICAAALIVEEAGGCVQKFRENRGISIVSGNPIIVQKIREKIR